MLVAQDFRDRARAALNGKWALAVGTGFVASLLGAGTIFTGSSSGSSSSSSDAESYETMFSEMPEEAIAIFVMIMAVMVGIALLWALVIFILGGPITLGYVKFNLNLVDNNNPQFSDLFSQFGRFGEGFLVQLLRNLYIFLWSLAFVFPGMIIAVILGVVFGMSGSAEVAGVIAVIVVFIVVVVACVFIVPKQYGYAMAPYILYENPGMGANQAIKESIQLMNGNKWRLFCLCISFIGWALLTVLTCGIGGLWLKPYQEAAYAAFYREIKRERYGEPVYENPSYVNPYEQDSVYSDYSNV
ncbi:MAG: DUF975 family protein [Lachnospiraceae bacterium]|nr:DUF975 family protein [Lachnospiraceae bacterium]